MAPDAIDPLPTFSIPLALPSCALPLLILQKLSIDNLNDGSPILRRWQLQDEPDLSGAEEDARQGPQRRER